LLSALKAVCGFGRFLTPPNAKCFK